MIQTMFLCAGQGTRLLPLTQEVPKPLVPLGDRPLLCHLLDILEQSAGRLHAVNAHHRAKQIHEFVDEHRPGILVSLERELLGTAGGVRAALAAFDASPLVVWNGDICTRPDLSALVCAIETPARPRLALLVEPRPAGEGNIGIDVTGRVVRLRQRTLGSEARGGNYVGVLAMHPDCFDSLPPTGCLIGDVAMKYLELGEPIVAVAHLQPWSDLGSLRAYHQQNLRWLRDGARSPSWIAPTATVATPVDVHDSIVGWGATVQGQGRLERVVVWPGATCSAPLADAIVTTRGSIVPVATERA